MAIEEAIAIEKGASERHYKEGFETAEKAAEAMIDKLKEYCRTSAPHLLYFEKAVLHGRNEPCCCGSNKKYKKCHGR
ncbi:MAG: SEC-C domain-containing protein [Deltaproteobacteria bacterium]|nr:SEC-C domain-containing protein [Deltaproteobacteria bacterium]